MDNNVVRLYDGNVGIIYEEADDILELDWLISMERASLSSAVMPRAKKEFLREFILNFTCKILRDHCNYKFRGFEV